MSESFLFDLYLAPMRYQIKVHQAPCPAGSLCSGSSPIRIRGKLYGTWAFEQK